MPGAATAPSTTEAQISEMCWPTAMSFGWQQPISVSTGRRAGGDAPTARLIGHLAAAARLRKRLAQVAKSGSSILFLGETGTGTSVAARYVHDSADRARRFVAINCTAVPDPAESQLFGHTRGAFTGAQRPPGLRAAGDGTPLLDEIGDPSRAPQPAPARAGGAAGLPEVRSAVAAACSAVAFDELQPGWMPCGWKFRGDPASPASLEIFRIDTSRRCMRDRRGRHLAVRSRAVMSEPTINLAGVVADTVLLLATAGPFNVRELVACRRSRRRREMRFRIGMPAQPGTARESATEPRVRRRIRDA